MNRVQLTSTVLVTVSLLAFSTQAGAQSWFDKIKKKAEEVAEDTVSDTIGGAKETGNNAATEEKEAAAPAPASAPAKSKPVVPQGETYGETFGSAAYLIQKWPYDGVKGKPVGDIELKGVKLGMPLPLAIEALDEEGYSRVKGLRFQRIKYEHNGKRSILSQAEYYNLPPNERGNIIRSYVVELEAIAPSEEIAEELPAFPKAKEEEAVKLTADERKRCELMRSRSRTWSRGLSGAEVREIQDKCNRASGDRPTIKQEPQYVSRIWYGQRFISGEKANFEKFIAGAKKAYGEPTYFGSGGHTRAAGAAYNRSALLWWVDSALVPKSRIDEMLRKSGNDDRSMVFEDFIHPGDAHNAFYPRAYQHSFDDMIRALRIAYAPHLAVGFEKGSYIVDLEWPFLGMEKSYRRQWEKREAKEAQPEAEFEF